MGYHQPGIFYTENIKQLTLERIALEKKRSLFAWFRLLVAVLAGFTIYALAHQNIWILISAVILFPVFFLWLVAKAIDTNDAIENKQRLIAINETELKVLAGNYYMLPEKPAGVNPFSIQEYDDLDLFGHASLFQFVNRSGNQFAQSSLAGAMVKPANRQNIELTQEAVKELAETKIEWCRQLQSFSNVSPIQLNTATAFYDWLKDENKSFDSIGWHVLKIVVPFISFTVLFLFLQDFIAVSPFITFLILILGFVFLFHKIIAKSHQKISGQLPAIEALVPLLKWIEREYFSAPLLVELQQKITRPANTSLSLASLQSILKKFEYRLNPLVYIPFSIFFFWDLQWALALQKWKKKKSSLVDHFFEVTGEFEMLASLAVLHFNNQAWSFPEMTDEWFDLRCEKIGHPLLPKQKTVLNSFMLSGYPSIAVITGSNMAGKSTFLRTIGTNMILGMCGAPVNAAFMRMPVVKILSSMRITDNLEEGTSTFYAELKKIKQIVDAANAGEKVFILVDEMLRGTNTLDRHTGSVALVKQLVSKKAVAVIATHDIELANLQNEFAGVISNYHFDSTIINDEIVFDFLLKDGVCKSTNASLLMKKIGIEI